MKNIFYLTIISISLILIFIYIYYNTEFYNSKMGIDEETNTKLHLNDLDYIKHSIIRLTNICEDIDDNVKFFKKQDLFKNESGDMGDHEVDKIKTKVLRFKTEGKENHAEFNDFIYEPVNKPDEDEELNIDIPEIIEAE